MYTGLIVGLSVTSYDVRAVLELNADRLSALGWQVAPEGHRPVSADVDGVIGRERAETTLGRWEQRLTETQGETVLFACVHLADALLMSGQAGKMIDAVRERGTYRCMALVRRFDDYTATRYLRELLIGRFRPLNERELSGLGANNYLDRLAKWHEAASPDFLAIMSTAAPHPEAADVRRLLGGLGVQDPDALTLPAPSPAKLLDPTGAEVLRRFNRLLHDNGLEGDPADDLRAAAVGRLTSHEPTGPFTIPAAAAISLLESFSGQIHRLGDAMGPADREQFVSTQVPDDPDVDEDDVRSRLHAIAGDLGLAVDVKRDLTADEQALADAKRFARRAKTARQSGDQEKYERVIRRLHRTIPLLPKFEVADAALGEASDIPQRVVQYWDPSPPPDQMVPWLTSWETVGMPGGEHVVADYETGLRAVEEVAGELGRQAYEMASHAAARSDLFRYAELYARGGWYADAEHEATLPLPDLFPWDTDHVLVVRAHRHVVVNNFIGARPGSPLLKEALLTGCRNVVEGSGGSIVQLTGPSMLTGLVDKYRQAPDASYVMVPTSAVFGGCMQIVHNSAEYKVHGHWRFTDLNVDRP